MSKLAALARFFRPASGRTLIVPLDHGTIVPVPGLEDPRALLETLNPYADGFIVNLGLALRFAPSLADKGVILRTDTGATCIENLASEGSFRLYGAAQAQAAGAHALMNMLFPGHPNEASIIRDCAALVAETLDSPLPVMMEALPYGLGRSPDYTPENIRFCVRLASELGADVVKTAYPGDQEAFRAICREAYVPVIILGGASGKIRPEDLLHDVAAAMNAGASGIAIGRNLWQHPRPEAMARALHAVVHENASPAQAALHLR